MTDAEVICTWMEPTPEPHLAGSGRSKGGWWARGANAGRDAFGPWIPAFEAWNSRHRLGALWEVEERLDYGQCGVYERQVLCASGWATNAIESGWALLHATPEQKIKAIAAVLRPIVEKPNAE